MSTMLNDRDVLLRAGPRNVNAPGAGLLLVASSPVFHTNGAGAVDPAEVKFRVTRVGGLIGAAAFAATGGATLTVAGDEATLIPGNMPGATTDVSATVTANGQTFTSNPCSVGKVVDGAPGTTARGLDLLASSQVFQINKAGVANLANIALTARQQGLGGTPNWTVPAGTATLSAGVDNWNKSLTFANTGTDSVTVRVTQDGIYDEVTIVKVREGSDSINPILTNESANVAATNAGVVGSFSGAGGTFKLYDGAVEMTGNAAVVYSVFSETGVDVSIAATGVYTVNSMSADTGTAVLRAVYKGLTFDKVYNISKSKQGEQGGQGPQGVQGPIGPNGLPTYTWIRYADTVAGAGISNDPTGKLYIGFAYNKTTATESDTAGDYKWALIKGDQGPQGPQGGQGVQGPIGPNGLPTYTWIKYADAADGTGLYDTPNANTLYIGIAPNKTVQAESTTKTDYIWSRFKGDEGSVELTLFARNAAVTGNSVSKTGGTNGLWDADVYSIDSFTGGAYVSFVVVDMTSIVMVGLNASAPSADSGFADLDYGFYLNGSALHIYESGIDRGAFGGYAAGDVLGIRYDGSNVFYERYGVVLRTVAALAGLRMFFDSSLNSAGAKLNNIRFGPLSSNAWPSIGGTGKPQDNATVGSADAATALGFNPQFTDWPTGQAYPTGWSVNGSPVVAKDTVAFRTPPFAVNITANGGESGLQLTSNFSAAPLQSGVYIKGSFDATIAVANGGGGMPGLYFRAYTNAALSTFRDTVVPVLRNDSGGWQRTPFTVGVNVGERIYGLTVFLIASAAAMPGGAWSSGSKIVFDNLAFDFVQPTDFSNVSGTGKPADNATVGAPAGSPVAGLDATVVKDTVNTINAPFTVTLLEKVVTTGAGVRTFTHAGTITGGKAPLVHSWVLTASTSEPGLSLTGGVNTATVTITSQSKAQGTSATGLLEYRITDGSGRSAVVFCNVESRY